MINLLISIMYFIAMIYIGAIYLVEMRELYPNPNYIIMINLTVGAFVIMIIFIASLANIAKTLEKEFPLKDSK